MNDRKFKVIAVIIIILAILIQIWFFKSVVNSDLPDWLKYWILK